MSQDGEITGGLARGGMGQGSDPSAPGAPREELAARYIRGAGIEFGALHSALRLPEGVSVKYADLHPVETLRKLFPDVGGIRAPDIVTDLESMRGIDDISQDFVIANHVLEHVEDPLRALKSIGRVLRPSGIAFLAVPDKRFTFDKDRKITPLDHLLRDHREGPDRSIHDHYEEWCRCIDGLQGDEQAQKVALMLKQRTNIHFHVWDYEAMSELFAYIGQHSEFNLELVTSAANGNEVVWILRKPGTLHLLNLAEPGGMPGKGAAIRAEDLRAIQVEAPAAYQATARCRLCESADTQIARADVGDGRSALGCKDCGFVFIWPRIEQDFSELPAEAYYGDWELLDLDSIAGLYADVIGARTRLGGAARIFGERLAVLDIGCGAGHALLHFRAHGWRVQGVDPWSATTEIGRKYYRLPIETARIENASSVILASQDLALSIDVLQFTADPAAHLEVCRSALKPGGVLYLTVPNFGSAESRREGWNWRLFLPRNYINYFTAEALTRLLQRTGFRRIEVVAFGGLEGDGFLRATGQRAIESLLSWADLSEEPDDAELPPLDRAEANEAELSPDQRSWRDNGYLILPRFMPDELIDRYCAVRERLKDPGGWRDPAPYLRISEIRDLCLYRPLADKIEQLLGEPMALHLNLTGWVSTERDWHQDDYLNPPTVNSHYAAVWIALEDIRPDAGPFEFVPGSHRWPFIRQAKVLSLLGGMDPDDENWPWHSERLLTPFFEAEIDRRELAVQRFLAQRGDVLIWHSRLVHRGSPPRRPGAERRALIAHYGAVGRRPELGEVRQHGSGGRYFLLTNEARPKRGMVSLIKARVFRLQWP